MKWSLGFAEVFSKAYISFFDTGSAISLSTVKITRTARFTLLLLGTQKSQRALWQCSYLDGQAAQQGPEV